MRDAQKERAAPMLTHRQATPEQRPSTASIADPAPERKQPNVGTCINCGQHIRLTGNATTCTTCSAWHRWYSAFRVASQALREVKR